MKTCKIHLILAAIAVTGLNAQDTKPPGDRRPPPPPLLLLPVLDTNDDGQLDATEINGSSDALAALDKNEDGLLSKKEIAPPPPKGKKPKGPKPPLGGPFLVRALDLDDDEVLSTTEIDDAPATLALLDKDSDGIISKAEMMPGKPPVKKEV